MDEKMKEINIVKLLNYQANEIATKGHAGWGNTMTMAADYIKELEARITELEPDALYLRKWREIKGSNPYLPCACQIDDDGKLVSQCEAHKEIISGLEEKVKELEEEKTMLKDKLQEAMIIAKVRVMATESLPPDLYEWLVTALNEICRTRHINNEILADKYIELSGKEVHASDCDTSCAPAEIPGPCNCDV